MAAPAPPGIETKAARLADYLEREGNAPPRRLVTDDGFRLGQFWSNLVGRCRHNRAVVEAALAERPAANAVYEGELQRIDERRGTGNVS